MTNAEMRVLDLLAEAHRAFLALPEMHPADLPEWVTDMHHLQNRVMAREAVRALPVYFHCTALPAQFDGALPAQFDGSETP
jgi:hypothetical protein